MKLRRQIVKTVYDRVGDLYLAAVIRRTNNFSGVTWLGHPIWQNVLDLWTIQEAIAEIRPAIILETGTNQGGSALFYAHLFDLMGGDGRILTVDTERMHQLEHPRVDFLIGSSVSDEILSKMQAAVDEAKGPVLIILDSDHSQSHVAAELEHYSPLVTAGSLMLVQDGVIDLLPSLRADRPGPGPAIAEFLDSHPEFYVDTMKDRRFLASHHPSGWLRKR